MKLARDTGVTVFRMGIDWSRVMPEEPTKGIKEAVSQENINLVSEYASCSYAFFVVLPFFSKTLFFHFFLLCRLTLRPSNTINGYSVEFVQME